MGRPKALLTIGSTTFLENIVDVIAKSGLGDPIVVLGHHRDEIMRNVRIAKSVFNEAYEQGMITSLQCGIRALPEAADGALVFLVDHPVVKTQTIQTLVTRFKPAHIVLPWFESRRGHPVLFAREILDEVLELPASAGANVVVRRDPNRIIEVPVEDPGVLIDVDTPDDYATFKRT